ncbi:SPFH domain-containing protein [Lactiplantibacillus paraxiangfangensis]|uniref:SPFH domain-containing protein n=1 Tax=Lactiplantibacillus paraxiangfangensis TaxID=3076224 RepID=UPI0030C719F4
MGLIKAFSGSISGTLADQWRDIITTGQFQEHTAIMPGVKVLSNNGHGSNLNSSAGVITQGSKVYVPENTALVLFKQGKIDEVVTEPGGYEYQDGQDTIFERGHGLGGLINEASRRMQFGGQPDDFIRPVFVNLREIRGIKFGTKGPQVYHDHYYDTDLEVMAYGNLSLRIVNPVTFLQTFVPANQNSYSFDNRTAHEQLLAEFLQFFNVALNGLSEQYRISQLPSQGSNIAMKIMATQTKNGNWEERFGMRIDSVGIENIQFSEDSRKLVEQFSANRMEVNAYKGISANVAKIAAQQKIAKGIQENGLGDGAGAILGVNMTQGFINNENSNETATVDNQIKLVKELKALLDAGVLTESEFAAKKAEVLGLK